MKKYDYYKIRSRLRGLINRKSQYNDGMLHKQSKKKLIKLIRALRIANNIHKEKIMGLTLELNFFKRKFENMQFKRAREIMPKDTPHFNRARGRPKMKYTQMMQKIKRCFGDPSAKLILTQHDIMQELNCSQAEVSTALTRLEELGEVVWIRLEDHVKMYNLVCSAKTKFLYDKEIVH